MPPEVSAEEFLNRFPDFQYIDAVQIQTALDEALSSTSDQWYAEKRVKEYVYVKTAERLAESQVGRDARVQDAATGVSVFSVRRRRLEVAFAFARSRTGTDGSDSGGGEPGLGLGDSLYFPC